MRVMLRSTKLLASGRVAKRGNVYNYYIKLSRIVQERDSKVGHFRVRVMAKGQGT